MSKLEIAILIDEAIEHTLKLQKSLLDHKASRDLTPIVKRLNEFSLELVSWRTGKFYLRDSSERFIKLAQEIEKEADALSLELWVYMPISLVAICKEIQRVTRSSIEDKTFSKRLKDHYNNLRLGLLEQVAGARMLENNSDLGDEVERIFAQHLAQTLGRNFRILRGGHIYDRHDNRSKNQVDLIITQGDALGYCPSDTGDGKHNVMIDQVVAVISVKSTLTVAKLEECWNEIQGLPEYPERTKAFPYLANHPWPVCLIVAAYSDDFKKLEKKWDELRSGQVTHVPQMVLVLDSGYLVPWDASWPFRRYKELSRPELKSIEGLEAGLGLGRLHAVITARSIVLDKRPTAWISNLCERLERNEAVRGIPATYEPRFHKNFRTGMTLHGKLKWGTRGQYVHNNLELRTIDIDGEQLLKAGCPDVPDRDLQTFSEKYRMFTLDAFHVKGDFCALQEWHEPKSRENHRSKIVVFNAISGVEVFAPEFDELTSVFHISDFDFSKLS